MVNELRWVSSAGAIIIGTEQLLLLTKGDGEHDVVQTSQLLMSFRRVFDFDRRFFLVDDLTAVNFSTPLFFSAIEDLNGVFLEEEVVVGPSSSSCKKLLMLLLASTATSGVLAARRAAAGDFPGVRLNILLTQTLIFTERYGRGDAS